jgi:hypothetical protein
MILPSSGDDGVAVKLTVWSLFAILMFAEAGVKV